MGVYLTSRSPLGSTTSLSDAGSETSIGSFGEQLPSRCSSRLSTNTFGFTSPNTPLMTSEDEPWRTAHPSTSQTTIATTATAGTIGDDDYLEQPELSRVMTPTTPTTSTTASHAPYSPAYLASSRVASMPELSRSTSTVNPSTPSTLCFPRMEHPHNLTHVISSRGSHRSMSMSSLKETLEDSDKAVVVDKWQYGRVLHYDGQARVNRDVIIYDRGHVHDPDDPHPHEYPKSHDDAAEWEDVEDLDERGKEVVTDTEQTETGADTDGPPAWTTAIPTREQVRDAAGCHLIDEWGNTVRFGDMLPGGPAWRSATVAGKPVKKVLALFVGHWWCGLCHDYALVSVAKLSPAALIREGVRVVIVSSGSWKVITKYRQMFNVKFPVFVDNGTRLYRALDLPKIAPNPFAEAAVADRPAYHRHGFARQMVTGMARGFFQLGGMKLRNPGNFMQLGGEFVFGLDLSVDYVHRMQGRGDHCEAPDVLNAVGVQSTLGNPVMSDAFEHEREHVRRRIRAGSHLQ
ncbi:hypothetical protein CspeluHIS016_0900390 [Cutaneotrichosporon spelunceum]|uniref:Uncharacterized protein n=1 Tax=Cutaneotrichosporon spelunceum TaxID=1672016 RepID=A0AAD3TZS6_9TREE|nr:hypothetical protein CspeluHIS016_0900390 [Cutaneotrichosporon spelunceum]